MKFQLFRSGFVEFVQPWMVTIAVWMLIVGGPACYAEAQENSDPGSTIDQASQIRSELSQTLKQQQEESAKLSDAALTPEVERLPTPQESSEVIRKDSVLKRIKLLESMINEKKPNPQNQASNSAKDKPSETTPPPPVEPKIDPPIENPPLTTPNQMSKDPEDRQEPINPVPTGTQILADPVNALELANSLFQTGIFPTAQQTYESIDPKSLSLNDQNWRNYFLASCFRIQQNLGKAESNYRELVETKEKNVVVTNAEWWLQHLEQRRAMTSKFESLAQEVDAIKNEDRTK